MRNISLSRRPFSRALALLLAGVLTLVPAPAFAAACVARSGAARAIIVELYTSEGCSSCPPADRWLSGFVGRASGAAPVIPLAFHVDYWDYIGWRDRFASPKFTARQYERVRTNHGSFAYTPQTLVDGRDSSRWRQARSAGELPTAAASAPAADLVLRIDAQDGRIAVDLETKVLQEGNAGQAVAYLALYENGLSSRVGAGENAGRELRHDFVVRDWVGPLPIGAGGSHHVFTRTDIVAENAGIAAVVELADGSRRLQGVSQALCR